MMRNTAIVNTLDLDGDGQTSCGEDCNDTDADIFVRFGQRW